MNGYSPEPPGVLVVCQLFYPELVSSGQTMTELCEELVALGAEVEVICGPPTIVDRKSRIPRILKYKGITVKRVWGTRLSKLSFSGKLVNHLTFFCSAFFRLLFDSSKRPVLATTNPPFLGVACAAAGILRGKKYIYVVFDVYPDTAERLGVIKERGFVARVWDWWNEKILRRASSVVVLGREMENLILKKGRGRSSLAAKIRVIHVWSDDRRIAPVEKKENPLRQRWNLEGKFVISYSGNMGRFHDMETIMETARELADIDDMCFLFIGEGQKKKWMEGYSERWNLTNCRFRTYVPRRELGISLACADVGLVSLMPGQAGLSEPSKTFGILAAGVPVIAVVPPQSEIVRIIREYDCGIIVEPNDVKGLTKAVKRLYFDSDATARLAKNAVRAVREKYSLKNAAAEYFDLIRSNQDGHS